MEKKHRESKVFLIIPFMACCVLNFYTQLHSHPDSPACINLLYTDRESYTDNSGRLSLYTSRRVKTFFLFHPPTCPKVITIETEG